MGHKGKKGERFKSAITGAASALNIYGSTKSASAIFNRIEKVSDKVNNGRTTDYNNIDQDWRIVGSDMRSAFNKSKHLANCD